MTLARTVLPETLDGLAEDDPRAIRSRRDLQRVNRVMGVCGIVSRGLRPMATNGTRTTPLRMLELGAGDGTLMLAVAKRLAPSWPAVELTLLDRQRLVEQETIAAFAKLGWLAKSLNVDVLDWIARPVAQRFDVMAASLFLHHFDDRTLSALLRVIGERCDAFFACEPRRAMLALGGSHLIGALLVNAVTREDAVLSVHAGFLSQELSSLWPAETQRWALREYSAGCFSHCLSAVRRSGPREAR